MGSKRTWRDPARTHVNDEAEAGGREAEARRPSAQKTGWKGPSAYQWSHRRSWRPKSRRQGPKQRRNTERTRGRPKWSQCYCVQRHNHQPTVQRDQIQSTAGTQTESRASANEHEGRQDLRRDEEHDGCAGVGDLKLGHGRLIDAHVAKLSACEQCSTVRNTVLSSSRSMDRGLTGVHARNGGAKRHIRQRAWTLNRAR